MISGDPEKIDLFIRLRAAGMTDEDLSTPERRRAFGGRLLSALTDRRDSNDPIVAAVGRWITGK